MSDRENSPLVGIQGERVEAAQQWLHQNGNNISGIEHKVMEEGVDADSVSDTPSMIIKRKTRRKNDGPMEIICGWIVEHQIGLSVNLLILLALTHLCFPRARRHTRKFFELSYYNADTNQYCSGWNDAWMVFFWIVVFTGLRTSVMTYILVPIAKKYNVQKKRDQGRFAEQAWLVIYYSVFWTLGMYILYHSKYWLNMQELWTDWPNREMGGVAKWYILVQYAYWIQQIMVINIEERRKDYRQMLTHHIVTTLLIFTSYGYHQTKVANLILCIMDPGDVFLAIAKLSKYMGYHTVADYLFGLFMVTWVILRHVLHLMICWSVYSDIPKIISYGCYKGRNGAIEGPFPSPAGYGHLIEPFRNPEGTVCWNNSIKWGFLSALLFLQAICIMWFAMIMTVAIKVLRGAPADDVRSDDEYESEDDIVDEKIIGTLEQLDAPLEEEVGVESINLKGRTSTASRYRKSAAASGVSLPGDISDRKELLGRIGCDKSV